jgi:hypothetical protein
MMTPQLAKEHSQAVEGFLDARRMKPICSWRLVENVHNLLETLLQEIGLFSLGPAGYAPGHIVIFIHYLPYSSSKSVIH